ncbi:MAG: periplasmic heavy metal sensor [Betaproteobacteria bacterium]|nr:periplasmic heavy metal sensor [Betaproteobacteria bacterium]
MALLPGAAGAQSSAPAPEQHRFHGHRMHHGGGSFHWLRRLNLTEAQDDQIFKLLHEQAPARRELVKTLRKAHADLRSLIEQPRLDRARVRQALEAESKARADLSFMRIDTMGRIKELLTSEQLGKLQEMRAKHRQMRERQGAGWQR